MLDSTIILNGAIMGFVIALIIGPMSILCFRRTIVYGFSSGIATGIGASIANACYAAIAAYGFVIITNALLAYQHHLTFAAGVYLMYLGFKAWYTTITLDDHPSNTTFLITIVSSTILTLTSPVTILAFIAFIPQFIPTMLTSVQAVLLTIGVFLGSLIWWIILSTASYFLREHLAKKYLITLSKFSGIMLFCFGLFSFLKVARCFTIW